MPETMLTAPLGQVASITMGQSPDSAYVNADERGLPFLQGCAEFTARFPVARVHCFPPLRVARAGSTLISVRAPVGTTNRADHDYCIGRGLAAVLAKPSVAADVFLLHAIEENLTYLHRRSQGSTFLAICSADLTTMPVALPALPQQQRIAEIFSTVDEAIEHTEALIAKTQQIKAGLMHDLFTRGVTPDGRLRPPREEAPQLYKESPIGWIPKEWDAVVLSMIADSLIDGPFGSNLKTEDYVEGEGVRVVRLQNILDGEYNDNDRALVSNRHATSLAKHQVLAGDILIAALGENNHPVARSCCYPATLPPAINKADCFRLRCKSSTASNSFVMRFLNTVVTRRQIRRYVHGVTRRRVNLGNLRRVVVALPSVDEQQMVVDAVEAVTSQLSQYSDEREAQRLIKAGLMHDLLTGRVRVTADASLDPARPR